MVLSLTILLLFFLYTALILYYQGGWEKLRLFSKSAETPAKHLFFTVVIPARNESANIVNCLRSILGQDYPADRFEVIVADDFSEDDTADLVLSFPNPQVRLLKMSDHITAEEKIKAHKKKSIETAIQLSGSNEVDSWIITTDADCIVSPQWLSSFNAFILEHEADFVAGPVDYSGPFNSFLSIFQSLDFLSLQGITGAAAARKLHVLCNGANIAYRKLLFSELGGFTGIDHIASGDDMLLMQKFYRHRPQGVQYIFSKEAIVRTAPTPTWRSFFHQRVRWASKADQYRDKKIFSVLLLVYLFNLSFLVLAGWSLFHPAYAWFLFSLLISKTLLELYFLLPVARFFGKTTQLIWFLPAQPFHILYTVIAGWLGKFGSYEWKGRTNTSEKRNT